VPSVVGQASAHRSRPRKFREGPWRGNPLHRCTAKRFHVPRGARDASASARNPCVPVALVRVVNAHGVAAKVKIFRAQAFLQTLHSPPMLEKPASSMSGLAPRASGRPHPRFAALQSQMVRVQALCLRVMGRSACTPSAAPVEPARLKRLVTTFPAVLPSRGVACQFNTSVEIRGNSVCRHDEKRTSRFSSRNAPQQFHPPAGAGRRTRASPSALVFSPHPSFARLGFEHQNRRCSLQ